MNHKEASVLWRDIRTDAPGLKADVRQIGNGEHVVIVNSFWLWQPDDWYTHRTRLCALPQLA